MLCGLILAISAGSASANIGGDKDKNKRPKNTGILSVKTSPQSMPIRIDGQDMGMTGTGSGREFYLAPGFHTVEVTAPDGKVWKQEIEIRKDQKHCVCLKTVEETTSKACPYRYRLEGPGRIKEGDLVTFSAIPLVTSPIALKYLWRVSPDAVRVTNGMGTPTITVDSTGMGGQTINAELDINDDVYDNRCRQVISVPTEVERIVIPPIEAILCDEFAAKTADDDKARLDNCTIQAQNIPDSQIYMVIYPGTSGSPRNSYERVSKRALDYMVKNRGYDPQRIQVVRGTPRTSTTYKIWIVPPGAQLPVAQ